MNIVVLLGLMASVAALSYACVTISKLRQLLTESESRAVSREIRLYKALFVIARSDLPLIDPALSNLGHANFAVVSDMRELFANGKSVVKVLGGAA